LVGKLETIQKRASGRSSGSSSDLLEEDFPGAIWSTRQSTGDASKQERAEVNFSRSGEGAGRNRMRCGYSERSLVLTASARCAKLSAQGGRQ
jgi:hypothetical protein